MNNKKQLIYYVAVIAAFVTTQAPFWVARKATAATTVITKKRVVKTKKPKRATATTKNGTAKKATVSTAIKTKNGKSTAKAAKPYKAISCSTCTFDENRKVLICEQGQGIKLELPVKVQKLRGNPLSYVAKLPKRKNALCGLPVPQKGQKLGTGKMGAAQQCGLVIDESRLKEASIVLPEKLTSIKTTKLKTATK